MEAARDAAQPADEPIPAEEQPAQAQATSKRALKRQHKFERSQERKMQRRAAEKQQKQQAMEQRRAQLQKMLDSMTEEEKAQWHAQRKEKHQQLHEARQAQKAKQHQALSAEQKVVIDLNFPGLMTSGELKSLCQQLAYSYSSAVNCAASQQLHLHLLGADSGSDIQAALQKQLPGHVHWAATRSEQPVHEFFQDSLSDLVYLTADSPNELVQLDSSKIYIIGGIVDRNRHKGICYKRAQEAGIATAKLPISQHVKLQTSVVITVNQVVDILSRVQAGSGWKDVLEAVLPSRKRVEETDGGGAEPPQAGDSEGAAGDTQEHEMVNEVGCTDTMNEVCKMNPGSHHSPTSDARKLDASGQDA